MLHMSYSTNQEEETGLPEQTKLIFESFIQRHIGVVLTRQMVC